MRQSSKRIFLSDILDPLLVAVMLLCELARSLNDAVLQDCWSHTSTIAATIRESSLPNFYGATKPVKGLPKNASVL